MQYAVNNEIDVDIQDKKGEDYVPPKEVLKPFTGSGNVLGK